MLNYQFKRCLIALYDSRLLLGFPLHAAVCHKLSAYPGKKVCPGAVCHNIYTGSTQSLFDNTACGGLSIRAADKNYLHSARAVSENIRTYCQRYFTRQACAAPPESTQHCPAGFAEKYGCCKPYPGSLFIQQLFFHHL